MTDNAKQYSPIDKIIMGLESVRQDCSKSVTRQEQGRDYPAEGYSEPALNVVQRRHSAGLMRVNHTGEVAAQALYKAQEIVARKPTLKTMMQQSAIEELDHLAWCARRLQELQSHPSKLVPIWYFGSFGLGLIAGFFSDQWNLGFLAETEYQVVQHLDSHLAKLPQNDQRSRAILLQMREDELHHAVTAEAAGAKVLDKRLKRLMCLLSKIMTITAYRV